MSCTFTAVLVKLQEVLITSDLFNRISGLKGNILPCHRGERPLGVYFGILKGVHYVCKIGIFCLFGSTAFLEAISLYHWYGDVENILVNQVHHVSGVLLWRPQGRHWSLELPMVLVIGYSCKRVGTHHLGFEIR